MNLRVFGRGGARVAVVGQGTWHAEQSPREALDALRHGLDLGMCHLDTAEMYGSGAAETLVGCAIEGRRDEVFLVSKVLPANASRRGTIAACERSLSRLQTDRLDCYLLHWRGAHPLAETVAAFEELRRSGKIRAWGVSNFDVDDLEELAALEGAGLPACNQVLYHLEERAIEHAVLPWCHDREVAIVAYTPFGQSPQAFDPHTRRGRVLQEIAASHGATARQVALAFLLRRAFVIPKAARRDHASENAGASDLQLTDTDCTRLDAAFPRGKARALPMV